VIRGQRDEIMGPLKVNMGPWNVNRVTCNVIIGRGI
jgi:hypothetical protein